MNIVNIAYEFGAFDPRLMRSGTASLVWNSARALARAGHRVSIVGPAHGQRRHLQEHYGAVPLPYETHARVPLELDPARWPRHPERPLLEVTTRALHAHRDGVDLYFLSNDVLDAYPGTFYPDPADEGERLHHCKPLVFQLEAVAFVRELFANEEALIHAHEPLHTYLVPAAFVSDPHKRTVAAVATNHPVNTGLYRPQLEAALAHLKVDLNLDAYADAPAQPEPSPLDAALRDHLPATRLDHPNPDGYLGFFSLVADQADGIDFMGEGQRDFYTTFADTPFEARYRQLAVANVMERNAHKHFVGGCALSDRWLARDERGLDRDAVLRGLGLDPGLPTFYHAARYAVHHKGQVELMHAVAEVLADREANFIIRCATGTGAAGPAAVGDQGFQAVADAHPDRVRLYWSMVTEETLFAHTVASDYCLFPSKYELDTFLIAQAEAMACGAVPIATAQEVTRHFGHSFDVREPGATGFAVARSFQEDDPLLTRALVERINEAINLIAEEPAEYARLARNARATARQFTWERCARLRAARFAELGAPGMRKELGVRSTRNTDAPPPGWGRIDRGESTWSVTYHSRTARNVAAFVTGATAPDVCVPAPLRWTGDTFQGAFPGLAPAAGLALLVTLDRGRYQWQVLPTAGD